MSPNDVNTSLYRALQRQFRNEVVGFVKARLMEADPTDWENLLTRGFPAEEWSRTKARVEEIRSTQVVGPQVRDDSDLLDLHNLYNVFQANRKILAPQLTDAEFKSLLACLREIKLVRDPLSHPTRRELATADALRAVDNAMRVLNLLGLPSGRLHKTYRLLAGLVAIPGARRREHEPKYLVSQPLYTRLPDIPTTIFGRDREVETVCSLLTKTRLVTLTGLGGVGKTSVALLVGHRLIATSKSRKVVFVELEHVFEPDKVREEIARSLGLARLDDLSEGETFDLILDNFEQVLGARRLISKLLKTNRNLRILVTSRAPLRIRSENVVEVEGLPYPDPAADTPLDDLSLYPAVALFVDVCRRANRKFSLTARNAAGVVSLCDAIRGLPLAIEIVAAQVRYRPLDSHVFLLRDWMAVEGFADSADRHRSLQATLEWSERLLSDDARKVLRRMSPAIPVVRTAAAALADLGDLDPDRAEAALRELIDACLMSQDDDGRLGMHPATAAFAESRLDSAGESVAMERQMAGLLFEFALSLPLEPAAEDAGSMDVDRWQPALVTYLKVRDSADHDVRLKAGTAMQRLYPYLPSLLTNAWEGLVPWPDELLEANPDASNEAKTAAHYQFVFDGPQDEGDDPRKIETQLLAAWQFATETGDVALGLYALTKLEHYYWVGVQPKWPEWIVWAAMVVTGDNAEHAVRAARLIIVARLIMDYEYRTLDAQDFEYLQAVAEAGMVRSDRVDSADAESYVYCLIGLTVGAYHTLNHELARDTLSWPVPEDSDLDLPTDLLEEERSAVRLRIILATREAGGPLARVEIVQFALLAVARYLEAKLWPQARGLLSALAEADQDAAQNAEYRRLKYVVEDEMGSFGSSDLTAPAHSLEALLLRAFPITGEV